MDPIQAHTSPAPYAKCAERRRSNDKDKRDAAATRLARRRPCQAPTCAHVESVTTRARPPHRRPTAPTCHCNKAPPTNHAGFVGLVASGMQLSDSQLRRHGAPRQPSGGME